ncbi:hypothetical protein JX266_014268 [Neoarthrinium moseri]|nr:hypothetical protein JX266_014268 [Neoarthrinium moseri]
MADPFSVGVSALTVIAAAMNAIQSLHAIVESYRGRDTTLARLQNGLQDLIDVLTTLQEIVDAEASMTKLLQGPVERRNSKLSHQVLKDYNEMIQATVYNLQIQNQRIEEKLSSMSGTTPSSRQGGSTIPDSTRMQFEAQLALNQTLQETQRRSSDTVSRLQARLDLMTLSAGPERDRHRLELQDDIKTSKQCVEVCRQASEKVYSHKIHIIGEVAAEDDTDQVVITTLANLFDVKKVSARNRSAQLVGSTDAATLQKLSTDRYSSRFGAVSGGLELDSGRVSNCMPNVYVKEDRVDRANSPRIQRQVKGDEMRHSKPSSNEIRKRATGVEGSL